MSNGMTPRRAARRVPLIAGFGLETHVWCSHCKIFRRSEIPPDHLRRCFPGARFRCRCGGFGHPSFRPPGELITPGSSSE
jgi:hypothetical protein